MLEKENQHGCITCSLRFVILEHTSPSDENTHSAPTKEAVAINSCDAAFMIQPCSSQSIYLRPPPVSGCYIFQYFIGEHDFLKCRFGLQLNYCSWNSTTSISLFYVFKSKCWFLNCEWKLAHTGIFHKLESDMVLNLCFHALQVIMLSEYAFCSYLIAVQHKIFFCLLSHFISYGWICWICSESSPNNAAFNIWSNFSANLFRPIFVTFWETESISCLCSSQIFINLGHSETSF